MKKVLLRFPLWLGLAAFSLTALAGAPDQTMVHHDHPMAQHGKQADASLSLDHAVEIALAGNPGLAKMTARAKAMAEVPSQRRYCMDILSY